jgi:hypothetical protein
MKAFFYKTIFFTAFVFCSFGFLHHENSPVRGSVDPINGAIQALLFSKTDTFTAQVGVDGRFYIDGVKVGQYTLMIEGRPPYRNAIKDGIYVIEGQPTDVGVIEMQQ